MVCNLYFNYDVMMEQHKGPSVASIVMFASKNLESIKINSKPSFKTIFSEILIAYKKLKEIAKVTVCLITCEENTSRDVERLKILKDINQLLDNYLCISKKEKSRNEDFSKLFE